MSTLDDLTAQFERFPGVGARQAKRFAFHVLRLGVADAEKLAADIAALKGSVAECVSCHRFFTRPASGDLCTICSDVSRDHSKLLVVAQDSDITPIERSGVYDGLYFVLGGTVPLLNDAGTKRLRGGALKATVTDRSTEGLTEVILGFAVNPDGENTARYVESLIEKLTNESDENSNPRVTLGLEKVRVSHLGRGLSTGSELEYADPETIKNALTNRS